MVVNLFVVWSYDAWFHGAIAYDAWLLANVMYGLIFLCLLVILLVS